MDGPALDGRPGTAAQRPGSQMALRASLPVSAMVGTERPSATAHSAEWPAEFAQSQQPPEANAHSAERAAATFRAYDVEGRNHLDRPQMMAALAEMGAVHGMSGKAIEDVLAMDPTNSRNQRYTLGDFLSMYGRLTQYQAKQARDGRIKGLSHVSEFPEGADTSPELRKVFCSYCQFTRGVSRMLISQTEMVTQQLHKMCLDIGILGEGAPLSHAAVDIAFTRCKASNSRRLTFEQWLRVLCVLSDESGWNLFEMTVQLAERLGAKGFPAPVDPDQVMPLKPSNLPKLKGGQAPGAGMPPPSAPAGDQQRAGTAAGAAAGTTVMASRRISGSAGGARGASPQRPPRFNTLSPPAGLGSAANGLGGPPVAWGPSPTASSAPGHPRRSQDHLIASSSDGLPPSTSVPLARMMAAMESKVPRMSLQLDPDNLPPWLQQLLERLQVLEAKVEGAGAGASGGGAPISERQMGQIKIMMQSQVAQATSTALEGAMDALEDKVRGEVDSALQASRASLPPEGSELAASLAELRSGLQKDIGVLVRAVEESSSANEGTQERMAALERELAQLRGSHADGAQALTQRLQQLEEQAASGAAPAGSAAAVGPAGKCPGCADLEGRVAKCEDRLCGHDDELAALKQALATAGKQQEAAAAEWRLELQRQEQRLKLTEQALQDLQASGAARSGTADTGAGEQAKQVEAAMAAGTDSDAAGQAVEDKLTELAAKVEQLEAQLHAQAAGLASTAASAASGAAKASEASTAAQAAQTAGASAAKRLDSVEAQLAAVAAQAKEATAAAASAAVAAAAAATTATAGATDPALAAKIQALEAQLADKKPGKVADASGAKLQALDQQLSAASAALKKQEAAAAATAAALAKLQKQVDAAAATATAASVPSAQDGMSPEAVAKLTEGFRTAAAQQLAEQGAALSQRIQGVEARVDTVEAHPVFAGATAGGRHEDTMRRQLEAMGLTGSVVVQLVKLASFGLDVTVLGELFKRQAEMEAELKRTSRQVSLSGAAPAAGGAGAAADAAAATSSQALHSANAALGSSSEALAEASKALAEATKASEAAAQVEADVQGLRKSAQLMQQAMQVLRREIDGLRPPLSRAEAAGMAAAESASVAGRRADEVAALVEALAAKHEALAVDVSGLQAAGKLVTDLGAASAAIAAAATAGPQLQGSASTGDAAATDPSGRVAGLESHFQQVAMVLGEVTNRFAIMERDLPLALTGYAKIVDLKESENHVLDRHQQLHDDMQVLKANLLSVHEDLYNIKAAVLVQQPATAANLSSVKRQSLVLVAGADQLVAGMAGPGSPVDAQHGHNPSMTVRPRTARVSGQGGAPLTMASVKSAPNGALGQVSGVGGMSAPPVEYEYMTTPAQLKLRKRSSGAHQLPASPSMGALPSAMSAGGGMLYQQSTSMMQRTSPAPGQGLPSGLMSASASQQPSAISPQKPLAGWSEAQHRSSVAAQGQLLAPGVKLN